MAIATLPFFDCYYEYLDNKKDKTLILSNSLGADLNMWNLNIPYLSTYFNIIRYDMRGHGKSSDAFKDNSFFSIADLANDVLALIDYLNKEKKVSSNLTKENTVFCGLSIGGQIGQWLGIHHPNLFDKLIICCTAAKIGSKETWDARIEKVQQEGIKSIATGTLERWLTLNFHQNNKDIVSQIKTTLETTKLSGYVGCCQAVKNADFNSYLNKISLPTLIIAAEQDKVTTINDAIFLKNNIPNAALKTVDALHLCNIEQPETFSNIVITFCFQ